MDWNLLLEVLGFSVGVVYLWWEYHADAKVWIASMVMPAISMWIYFSKGLYADFGINIYYLIIAVYGYAVWTSGKRRGDKKEISEKKTEICITHTPFWACGVSVVALGVLWMLLSWVLVRFTDSTVPYADAFTTALSIVGMWMMARKFAEQWLVWFVVDIVCVALYLYKGLVFYPILYTIYTVIAIFGYRKWLRLMKVARDREDS